eukprot:6486596-Amphidinium_carterae.2
MWVCMLTVSLLWGGQRSSSNALPLPPSHAAAWLASSPILLKPALLRIPARHAESSLLPEAASGSAHGGLYRRFGGATHLNKSALRAPMQG